MEIVIDNSETSSCISSVGLVKKMVSHLLAVGLPLTIFTIAMTNFSYFSWHPICMSAAVSRIRVIILYNLGKDFVHRLFVVWIVNMRRYNGFFEAEQSGSVEISFD